MTMTEDERDLEEPTAAVVPENSLLGRLRKQRDEAARRTTTSYPVPTYKDPELVATFRLLGEQESKQIGERVKRQFDDDGDRQLWSLIDMAISACTGMYAREPDANPEDLQPIGLPDEPPIRIDSRLAEALGFDANTAREAFLGLFGGPDHIAEAADWAYGLGRWMSNTTTKLDREGRLGER